MPPATGVSADGLSTTVLPYASGSATARSERIRGAFQGAMPATTLAGWRAAMEKAPDRAAGRISPVTAVTWLPAPRPAPVDVHAMAGPRARERRWLLWRGHRHDHTSPVLVADQPAGSRSRSLYRWIFPVAVFGSSSTNSIQRGYL